MMRRLGLLVLGAVTAMLLGCGEETKSDARSDEAAINAAVCTPDLQAQLIAAAETQPIVPPFFAGGLDLDGKERQTAGVKARLCGPTHTWQQEQPASQWSRWGNIDVRYDASTDEIQTLFLGKGYSGVMRFKSRPGGAFGDHTYEIAIGKPILRDGQPFDLPAHQDIFSPDHAKELFDAMIGTYAPSLTLPVLCRIGCFGASETEASFHAQQIGLTMSFEAAPGQTSFNTPSAIYFSMQDARNPFVL